MTDSSIDSLVYVCRVSGARLRDLGCQLETAEPRRVEPILRAIQAEGDGLSAALTRLSHYADALPDEEAERADVPPNNDPRLLEVARLLRIAGHGFVCEQCGGVHSRSELDEAPAGQTDDLRAKQRARQRAHEARR